MPNQSNFTGNPFVKLWRSCISSIIAVASSHYTCHDSIGLTQMWDVGPQSPKPLPKQQKEMSSYMSLRAYLAFVKSVNVKKTNGERVNPYGNRDQLCSSLSNSVKKIGKSVSETHTHSHTFRDGEATTNQWRLTHYPRVPFPKVITPVTQLCSPATLSLIYRNLKTCVSSIPNP